MDYSGFISELDEDLQLIPEDNQLQFIQQKIARLPEEHRGTVENIVSLFLKKGLPAVERPETVVIMIHGIRTQAIWQGVIKEALEGNSRVVACPITYEYKNVFGFIFPIFFKKGNIDFIEKQLRSALRDHKGKKVVLVAHSFGTYALSEILRRNQNIKLDRLVLCGSIVKEYYPWGELGNFPTSRQ